MDTITIPISKLVTFGLAAAVLVLMGIVVMLLRIVLVGGGAGRSADSTPQIYDARGISAPALIVIVVIVVMILFGSRGI